jgi:flagellin
MIINTNIGSSTAARILGDSTSALQKSLKRLSTGSKIASISDDSAGSAVASKFGAEIKRLRASEDNLGNMLSFSQTQDGYLEKVQDALTRMSELAMLATDETKQDADRAHYDAEFQKLEAFIVSVGSKTFNGINLFTSSSQTVTVGIGSSVTFDAVNLAGSSYTPLASSASTAAVSDTVKAAKALTQVQTALSQLATDRAAVGSNISRLTTEKNALSILRDNMSAAKSRIVDVDVAEESANFAKQQILVQSGTAMLAQANILPQSALRLIS